jgi:hypothetical protein
LDAVHFSHSLAQHSRKTSRGQRAAPYRGAWQDIRRERWSTLRSTQATLVTEEVLGLTGHKIDPFP